MVEARLYKKQSIYIECYEGLSARMLTEALLDLMPEGKAAKKTGGRTAETVLLRSSKTGDASQYAGTDP